MAALLGGVAGGRGEATRLGTPKSPIRTRVQTWKSQISVRMEADGSAYVELRSLNGGGSKVLWEGNADDLAGLLDEQRK